MEIKRDYYLQRLIKAKNNGLIKIITGIRRCGKSYLLNTLFYNHLLESGIKEDHIIRFAFDSGDDLSKIGESFFEIENNGRKVNPEKFISFINSQLVDNQMYYLLLDEVQQLSSFELVLNGYLRKPNIDIYVTGSNSNFLSKDIATEFSGRGFQIKLYPLSFAEFMSQYNGSEYAGLLEYMTYGGIPLVALSEDHSTKVTLLENLFYEVYLSDIKKRYHLRKLDELEDLLNIISSSVGSLTNPEKLKNTFKSIKKIDISSNTIKKYLDTLEDSFLIKAAYRYDIRGKKYIGTPLKYYFSDLGLRNVRLNFRQTEETHLAENIIYNELLIRGYNVDVGIINVNQRSENGKQRNNNYEIDFVANLGSLRYYIQSAFSIADIEKMEQETRPFKYVGDSFKKILITKDMTYPHYNDEGVFIINIIDFLLNRNSLV